jgi:hypothetical protein
VGHQLDRRRIDALDRNCCRQSSFGLQKSIDAKSHSDTRELGEGSNGILDFPTGELKNKCENS